MEFRQLRYFAAVAEELSFTRAAEKLHVSQPPLSHQIGVLEEELGSRLFVRTSRSVQLSEAGKALLPHVLAVFESLEEGRLHVQRVTQGLEGRVSVGITGSHFLGPLPHFIKDFRQSRPNVEVVLKEMAPADQLEAMTDLRVDLSFSRGIPPGSSMSGHLLWRDATVVVLPAGHRLSSRQSLHLQDLKDEDFVSLRLGSSIFVDSVYDACIAARFEPRIVQQVVEVLAVLNLVAAGLGVAVVPESVARQRAEGLAICQLHQEFGAPGICADVYLARRSDEQRPVVLEFVQRLVTWAMLRNSKPPDCGPSPTTAC